MRQLLTSESSDIVYDSGFATPVSSVHTDNIPDIVKAVCLHTTVLSVKAELDQMAEGLELFGILNLVRDHPSVMQSLFVFNPHDAQLTVDQMGALFDTTYSPQGSTKRVIEEAAFMHWDEFLHDLGNGLIGRCAL